MKSRILLAFLFILPAGLYARPDSSKFVIRFNGGYADVGSSNGATSLGAVSSANRQWNVGLAAGYIINKHWEAGIGFSYQKQKTQAQSTFFLPIQNQQWLGMEYTETDIHLATFDVYVAGYWRLFSRLYFTPKLAFSIGGAKGTQESYIATAMSLSNTSVEPQLGIGGGSAISGSSNSDISYDYAALRLAPAFTFYVSRHFALNLEVGSFQFSTTDWEWYNKQWEANVNPSYWRLGVIFAF